MRTYEMPEVPGDHELQRLCRTGGIARNHRVARHNLADGSRMRVQTLRRDLSQAVAFRISLSNFARD